MRMLQPWSCDKCEASGSVPFEKDEVFMTVFYAMEDAHKEKSPDCSMGFPNHVKLGYRYPDPTWFEENHSLEPTKNLEETS